MRALLPLLLLVPMGVQAQSPVTIRTEKAEKKGVWTLKIAVPNLKGASPLATRFNAEVGKIVNTERRDFVQMVADNLKEFGKPTHPFAFDASGVVASVTPTFASAYIEIYTDAGGAHPNVTTNPVNVRLVGGKATVVKLKDLLAPGAGVAKIHAIVLQGLNAEKRKRGGDALQEIKREYLDLFVVTPAGVTWVFGTDTVGVHAEGPFHIKVGWSKLDGLVVNPIGG